MKSKIINSFCILLVVCAIGCKKEKDIVEVSQQGAKAGVGFGAALADGLPVYALPNAGTVNDSLKVFFSGTSGSSTEVTIEQDNSIVDEYNSINGTSIAYAPAGFY